MDNSETDASQNQLHLPIYKACHVHINLPTASHALVCENWCVYLCLVPRPHPAFHRFPFNFLFTHRDSLGIRLCVAVLIALENIDKQDVEKQTQQVYNIFSFVGSKSSRHDSQWHCFVPIPAFDIVAQYAFSLIPRLYT